MNLLYIPAVIGSRLLLLALLRLLVRFALVLVFTQPPAVQHRRRCLRGHARPVEPASLPRDARGHWRATPPWAEREIVRLAFFVRSCRRVADAFNAIHGHRRTIGKSTVAKICRAHATEIATRRRRMRRTPPAAVPVRARWSLDLSFAGDPELAQPSCILGILDQGSRALLRLRALPRKCTWTLLGHLYLTIAEHGLPESIRADNESMFTSRLWKGSLRLAGIRRERIRVRHPWQNGRVERCFGTLKAALRDVATHSVMLKGGLQGTLDEFASFYNHVRVHQGLAGLTPAQALRGLTHADVRRHPGRGRWVQALGGVLLGYRIRCLPTGDRDLVRRTMACPPVGRVSLVETPHSWPEIAGLHRCTTRLGQTKALKPASQHAKPVRGGLRCAPRGKARACGHCGQDNEGILFRPRRGVMSANGSSKK